MELLVTAAAATVHHVVGTDRSQRRLARRAAYLFVSVIVVTSLSFVWIFSRHALYPALHHQHALLHMTPLFNQQLAGFVAKLRC